jgi:hypothetical protein
LAPRPVLNPYLINDLGERNANPFVCNTAEFLASCTEPCTRLSNYRRINDIERIGGIGTVAHDRDNRNDSAA